MKNKDLPELERKLEKLKKARQRKKRRMLLICYILGLLFTITTAIYLIKFGGVGWYYILNSLLLLGIIYLSGKVWNFSADDF